MTRTSVRSWIAALTAASGLAAPALAQLRVCAWNISSYGGNDGREPSFKTAIYGTYQGRTLRPDIVVFQEITGVGGANAIRTFLNDTSAGSPGDWAIAPYTQGPDTNMVFAYRDSTLGGRVTYVGKTLIAAGGNSTGAARDIWRYDVRLAGYTSAGASLSIYGDHFKAGSSSGSPTDDQERRLVEATAIRNDANSRPAGWQIIVCGDFNMRSSTESAYQELVGSFAENRGRFVDPIHTPGTWYNTSGMRFVHTQAPGGVVSVSGGMDDRFDHILVGSELVDSDGFDYLGNPAVAYSTTTWNDPNHSYRSWGNDGSSFNQNLNTTTNAMVGPAIATALKATADTDTYGGHLPVFLDLRVPPVVDAGSALDFGSVPQNSLAQATLTVSNAGDTVLWNQAGIAALHYSLAASSGLTAPSGSFIAAAGTTGNDHTITLDTASVGPFSGTVTITSNSPDEPVRIVPVTGTIVGACYANCDDSTTPPVLNVLDFACFINRYATGDPSANCDGSTIPPVLNVLDFACFINVFAAGCP